MTYNIKNLNVASLDFDNIKESLTTFLEQQSDLKDLDFRNDASAVNLLLNILSTVTAYNGVYAQYGFINTFASTATVLESILGIASNSSVLIPPVKSSKTNRTVTTTSALDVYSAFTAKSPNGSDLFFFNTEAIPASSSQSINLYCGTEVVFYTGYDYTTQSCELPYTVDPETIGFYETDVYTEVETKWTRVDKSSLAKSSENKYFTVINGPRGYIVTNNFPSGQLVTTSSKIVIKAITSNGSAGNNAIIYTRSNTTFGTTGLPVGGYDLISVAQAKSSLLFKATGQERCVTIRDYKNAILSSGISGTENESLISVSNSVLPGQVKVYITGLGATEQAQLMDYLSTKVPVGISLVYQL
jgi:hypothetical protein